MDSSGKFIPAPSNFLESENDDNYYYNSCRMPWRYYLINGNEDAKRFADDITDFIIKDTQGATWKIMADIHHMGRQFSTRTAYVSTPHLCLRLPAVIIPNGMMM